MAQEKRQSFMKGAIILTASTFLVKVLGLLFSIPLANVISNAAMSYFYTAYDIFGMFLMLSTAGLPIAVSRMVGTSYAQGRLREADQVLSVAFWLFTSIGILGALAMFFGAEQISQLMGNPGANWAIMALAPTMFFISISSSLRGYFQGRSNMTPTAVSQTLEAVTKVVIGVGLAYYMIRQFHSDSKAAVAAIVGVSVSAGLGTIYLVGYLLRQKRRDKRGDRGGEEDIPSRKEMLLRLVRFAVPITLGSVFLSLLDNVDSAILMNRLQTAAGFSLDLAEDLRGVLGHARKFFDLPGSFVVPISTSLLPVLSGAVASHDQKSVDHITSTSLRVTLLISIPASVGMCLFSSPICGLLLFSDGDKAASTAPLLAMLSVAIVFNSTLYTTNAILQSFGHATIPVINMALGGIVKIALSYFLIGIPEINVMGSAVSTVISYFVIMVLNFISLRRCLPNMDSIIKTALPILLASAVMGVVSFGVYCGVGLFFDSRLAVIPAIAAAVLVYAVCIVALKAVTYEDVILLPKGEKIAKLLHVSKRVAPRHMK